MTEGELKKIEEALGVRLPASYRELMSRYAALSEGFGEYILDDPGPVIGINNEMRTGEFSAEWRPNWFIIGNDASGSLLFVNLHTEGSPVYLWDHETHKTSELAVTLDQFYSRLREDPDAF